MYMKDWTLAAIQDNVVLPSTGGIGSIVLDTVASEQRPPATQESRTHSLLLPPPPPLLDRPSTLRRRAALSSALPLCQLAWG